LRRRDDELARGDGRLARFVVGLGMSALNERPTDTVFAQLAGTCWLGDTGGDYRSGRLVPAPQNGLRGDTKPDVADRLARCRPAMLPVAVLTVIAALVAAVYAWTRPLPLLPLQVHASVRWARQPVRVNRLLLDRLFRYGKLGRWEQEIFQSGQREQPEEHYLRDEQSYHRAAEWATPHTGAGQA
jgi:hypothetical protein